MKKLFIILVLCLLGVYGFAQAGKKYAANKKGHWYAMWGWNRAAYSNSNISFKGNDYNFKLLDVVAHDRPTLPVSYYNYFKLDRITIPQTNSRIGYFIKDNLAISLGVDHMKYVMDQDQTVNMQGYITQPGAFFGRYNGPKKLTEDLLTFEHTDGLNYINTEIEKYYTWFYSKNKKFAISGLLGAGVGVMFPKTNVKLLNYERNDRFHISGFGLSSKIGIQAIFFKHLILKFENKFGYINMPDIILHNKGIAGRAKQDFFFTSFNGMIGGTFSLKRKSKK